jgi:hypothetical protein
MGCMAFILCTQRCGWGGQAVFLLYIFGWGRLD